MAMVNDFSVKGGYQAPVWLAGSGSRCLGEEDGSRLRANNPPFSIRPKRMGHPI